MNLNEVNQDIHGHRPRKRLGRGVGSGLGKTSGRGHKGHKSRSGYSRHPSFEGGQLPMIRRIPKRGFNNVSFAPYVVGINVGTINAAFAAGEEVCAKSIRAKGLVKLVCDEIKILGDGEVTKPLKVIINRVSKSARSKIEAAGGSVELVRAKRTPRQRVAALKAAKQS